MGVPRIFIMKSDSAHLENVLLCVNQFGEYDFFDIKTKPKELISQLDDTALFVFFYDEAMKKVDSFVKQLHKNSEVKILLLTEALSVKEQQKLQSSKNWVHALIKLPASENLISKIVADLLGVDYSNEEVPTQKELPSLPSSQHLIQSTAEQEIDIDEVDELEEELSLGSELSTPPEIPQELGKYQFFEQVGEQAQSISNNIQNIFDNGSQESTQVDYNNENEGISMSDDDLKLDLGDSELSLDDSDEQELSLDSQQLDDTGDDLALDLGDGEDSDLTLSDMSADELSLDSSDEMSLGENDELSLDTGDDLSLGDETSGGLELNDSMDDELDLSDEGLSLDSGDELDLSNEEETSADALPGGDLDALDLGDADLSFGSNEEIAEQEVSLDDDLGLAPEDDEELSLEFGSGDEVDLVQESSEQTYSDLADSTDFNDKLAEIDALMADDSGPSLSATEDATGDINIGGMDLTGEIGSAQDIEEELFNEASYAADKSNDDEYRTSTHVRNQLSEIDGMDTDGNESASTSSKTSQFEKFSKSSEMMDMHSDELARLAATINHLREDREKLLKKIESFEDDKEHEKRELLNLRAELDERKIELSLVKKRFSQREDEQRAKVELAEEKKRLIEEKNKQYHVELEKMSRKVHVDLKKIHQREKELESQLELLKSDAQMQIKNRDQKILDLKRRIDSLEFDIDQLSNKEKKQREEKFETEDKMDKLMKTLRAAISIIEEDERELKNFDFIKKNLDM